MSQLKVNSIIPVAGLSGGASGGIIQTIQTTKTDTFSESLSQAEFSGDTGLNVTITPTSSSNKILIFASVSMSCDNDNRNGVILFRGSSALDGARGAENSPKQRVSSAAFNSSTSFMSHHSLCHLDSPNTTSATTYGIRLSHGRNSTATAFMNRAGTDGTGSDRMRAASFITVMEVTV